MVIEWSRIHSRRSFSVLTIPLAVCSFLYRLGVRFNQGRHGRHKGHKLPGVVVSVGGLTAGGSGKTPTVAALARWAFDNGHKVSILSRGYGRRQDGSVVVVSDMDRILAGSAEAGDEPLMLAGMLPGIPVVVAKKRHLAGLLAHRRWGADFFILDDGFQHLTLKRDLDVVLLDAADPIGNGHLLPWGPLREPIKALERADLVLLTRSNPHMQGRETADAVIAEFPGIPCARSIQLPSTLSFPCRGLEYPAGYLKGRRVAAFCGIARPDVFNKTLVSLGAEVTAFRRFRDHHPFTETDICELQKLLRKTCADLLITTEKDWMRAGVFLAAEKAAGFLRIATEIYSGADILFDMIRDLKRV